MSAAMPSLVEAATALRPQIEVAADEIERSRRLPLRLVEAIARAGLFRLWIPRALGGEETEPMTLVRVVEEVSRADGSTGWCVVIGGEYGAFGGYLPRDAAREIHGSVRLSEPRGPSARSGMPSSSTAATASPVVGRWEAAAGILPGSFAAAAFWTVTSHASGGKAPR